MIEILFILGLIFGSSHGILEECDHYQETEVGRTYFISSPEYPRDYPTGRTCRWFVVSPPGTRMTLTCEEFRIPSSQSCRYDGLGISRKGKVDFSDAEYFCGEGSVNVVSESNHLNMILMSMPDSPGGTFFCYLDVKALPPPKKCSCGLTNHRAVTDGYEKVVDQYPMMAALVIERNRQLFCGATIISPRFALTAAHCLYDVIPKIVSLLVGDPDMPGNGTALHPVERFYFHPGFNSKTYKNDIALVLVMDRIYFSRRVGPVCLPFLDKRNSFAGEIVYALGWDSIRPLKVPFHDIGLGRCRPSYEDKLNNKLACTYRMGGDACQGDSGGPLLWKDESKGVVKLVGVISYDTQCATNHPSVSTRVTSYLNWIEATTGEDFCIM